MKLPNRTVDHCCEAMRVHLSDAELGLSYTPKFHEYGLNYRDGGTSIQLINFCPWCGSHLGMSRRDEWFDKLESIGIDPLAKDIPVEFQSDEWWLHQKSSNDR